MTRCSIQGRAIFLFSTIVLVCKCGTVQQDPVPMAAAGEYIAFSLREAERHLRSRDATSPALTHLGGMARIVGGVFDPESADIILVGKAVEARPAAHLDDLIVALRARLVRAVWPLVSIDPTDDTPRTSRQTVRLEGGIRNTQFGAQFLDCDIMLKKYSLGLLDSLAGVKSYKAACEEYRRKRLGAAGVTVRSTLWLTAASALPTIQSYHRRPVRSREYCQNRFWFWPRPSSLNEYNGVFFIRDLCLGVTKEAVFFERPKDDSTITVGEVAAEEFAAAFTERFGELAMTYPELMRLETLYAMVAAAEAIAQIKGHPELQYLLYDYDLPEIPTAMEHDLIELCGVLSCSDGSDYLMNLSGGIELRVLLEHLNGGDVDALRKIVLGSRPDERSLCWTLPLSAWRIPHDHYCHEERTIKDSVTSPAPGIAGRAYGFSLTMESVVFPGPDGLDQDDDAKGFGGFSPPRPIPVGPRVTSPFTGSAAFSLPPPGGVYIAPELQLEGRVADSVAERILQSRPHGDSLFWPVEDQKEDQQQ